jgi:hypothetical protein
MVSLWVLETGAVATWKVALVWPAGMVTRVGTPVRVG